MSFFPTPQSVIRPPMQIPPSLMLPPLQNIHNLPLHLLPMPIPLLQLQLQHPILPSYTMPPPPTKTSQILCYPSNPYASQNIQNINPLQLVYLNFPFNNQ